MGQRGTENSVAALMVVLLAVATTLQAIAEPLTAEKGASRGEKGVVLLRSMVTVNIVNNLGDDSQQILVHCKSKNDDLREHTVAHGGAYNFKFRPNFFGGTLFFCGVTCLPNGPSKTFDAYDESRDGKGAPFPPRCHTECNWSIEKFGIMGYSQKTSTWEKMYDWH